jgi:hypothetical protein
MALGVLVMFAACWSVYHEPEVVFIKREASSDGSV